MRATAEAMGVADTFGPEPLAIFFGPEGRTVPDPFFGGDGPARTGCRFCGACMGGCPHGSKNSLDYNYLHLAERRGVQIRAEHRVTRIEPLPREGYRVEARHPWRRRQYPAIQARHVILSAGVLGTLKLLFRSRDRARTLPNISPRLGQLVCTNSEAITSILSRDPDADLSRGPAISSHFYPHPSTRIFQNRLAPNENFLRLHHGPLIDGERPTARALKTIATMLAHPGWTLGVWGARDFARRVSVLVVMQQLDNELAFRHGRLPMAPWRTGLRSGGGAGKQAPTYLPLANQATREFAKASGGYPLNMLIESVANKSVTAHILGGAVIGANRGQGVIDTRHEVFGHPGLYVVDASAIPVNLGVNPSLTITALAERFAGLIPPADAPDHETSSTNHQRKRTRDDGSPRTRPAPASVQRSS